MDFEGTESQASEQVAGLLGRSLSDDEWEALKQAVEEQAAAKGGSGATSGTSASASGRSSRAARGVAGWTALLIAALLFGAAFVGLLVGFGWAFGLEASRIGITNPGEFVGAAVVLGIALGLATMSQLDSNPLVAWLIVAAVFAVGLVAIAVGALIRLA